MNKDTIQTKEERYAQMKKRNEERALEAKQYACKRFGLTPDEVAGYNSGICYSKIWVTNRKAAEKVKAAVKGETVNGGMFHDMPLGGINTANETGTLFEVMC